MKLPDDPRVRDLTIRPHTLESYDTLAADITDPKEHDDHDEPDRDRVAPHDHDGQASVS